MFAGQLESASDLAVAPGTANPEMQSHARSLFAGLPLMFEPNEGQANLDPADSRAKFVSRGAGYSLFLGAQGAILSLVSRNQAKPAAGTHWTPASEATVHSIEMKLAGANPNAGVTATDRLTGRSNYFLGNDPAKWRSGVPQFARVRYENIYPGISLVFYGNQGHLEYDFQVAPGSDPAQAELEFRGAKQLAIENGALVIHSEGGSMRLEAPVAYQETAGKRESVAGSFVLRGANRAGFAIGAYDRSRELIIDPILDFSTYFGGSGDELATSVAVDASLNIYLTGSTTSANLPIPQTNVFQTTLHGAGPNVYIAKITPPLSSIPAALDYVTYLGGTGSDAPADIAVDGAGNPYVAGTTSSLDFPTTPTNAYQSSPTAGSPGPHVFVTKMKFDFTGLLYSSYLSGNGSEMASGMTIDPAGNLYVTGTTTSNNVANAATGTQFPASTIPDGVAFQQISNAAIQFFVTKVNTNASSYGSIAYSTYFGGANFTPLTGTTGPTAACGGSGQNTQNLPCAIGGGIAVDTNANVYFTGTTNFTYTGCTGCSNTDFPILDAYQACLDQPPTAVLVNPLSCSYATPPPGPDGFAAPDAFAAKLNPNGAQGEQLLWSTYLGGTQSDYGLGIALDQGAANVYVIGTTNSPDFDNLSFTNFASYQKCLNNLPQTPPNGIVTCTTQTLPAPNDAFVARLSNPSNPAGTANPVFVALNYFSYLGGANNEAGTAITVDSNSGAVVTGSTQSPFTNAAGTFPLFPAPNSLQSQLTGTQDAFVARINTAAQQTSGGTTTATTASWASYFGGSTTSGGGGSATAGTGIALDVNQNTYLAGDTNAIDLPVQKPLSAPEGGAYNGGYDAFVTQLGTAVSLSIEGVLTLGTNQTFISAGNPATFTYTVTNNGPDLASNIVVTDDLSPQYTGGITFASVSATISSGTCGAGSSSVSISCGPVSLPSGSTATVTIEATPTPNSGGASPESFNGGTVQAIAPGNIVLAQTSVPAEMSDYSMSVSPLNQTVPAAGYTATYQVQLTPHPIYSSSITLSCSGLPTGATCDFTPSSSTTLQSASGATVTLSIPTTVRPITTPAMIFFTPRFFAVWLTLPGLALLGIGGNRRRRRILGLLMFCVLSAMLLFLPACSRTVAQAPQSGTPAGSYTITVTATSGSDSKSQAIVLNVP